MKHNEETCQAEVDVVDETMHGRENLLTFAIGSSGRIQNILIGLHVHDRRFPVYQSPYHIVANDCLVNKSKYCNSEKQNTRQIMFHFKVLPVGSICMKPIMKPN